MLVELLASAALQAGLTPLPAHELAGLLDGVRMDVGEMVLVSGGQYFHADGTYVVPGRVLRQGSWRAEDGRLCHRFRDGADETCMIVLTDGRGGFFSAESEVAVLEGRIDPVRFVPQLTAR